jgi:hypothetical protein
MLQVKKMCVIALCVLSIGSLQAQRKISIPVQLPKDASKVQDLQGKSFEAGIDFEKEERMNSYGTMHFIEEQMKNRGYISCPKNALEKWSEGASGNDLIAWFFVDAAKGELAMLRAQQIHVSPQSIKQKFRFIIQRLSNTPDNERMVLELCGK